MWLSSSSVGRKFVMAVSGAVLVLFVTFHCLMNAIAICWPATYNSICMFLGANWYALLASVVLAAFIVVHIVYAVILTVKNRAARGSQRYSVSKRPATVEWSSNNMFVLGIFILAFLVVHLIQFWARMQLQEICGSEDIIPPTAGTLFLQKAFSQFWTPIVYIIGFVALWFHLNHGFWSMFQSIGWDSTVWIPRLKKIAAWWTSIVILCFIAQAIVFTVRANQNFYKTDPTLRSQYVAMAAEMYEEDFGPQGQQAVEYFKQAPYDQIVPQLRQMVMNIDAQYPTEEAFEMQMASMTPEQQLQAREQRAQELRMFEAYRNMVKLFDFLEDKKEEPQPALQMQPTAPQQAPQNQQPQ